MCITFNFFVNRKLATLLDVKPSGSRIEVVSGKDGTPYLTLGNSTNKAELACKIMGLDLSMSTIFKSFPVQRCHLTKNCSRTIRNIS